MGHLDGKLEKNRFATSVSSDALTDVFISDPQGSSRSLKEDIGLITAPLPAFDTQQKHCYGIVTPGEFPVSANPSVVRHVRRSCSLDPKDFGLKETRSLFRQPAHFAPDCVVGSGAMKSNQHCVVKAPGGKLVYHTTKKRASGPKYPVTGSPNARLAK